MFKNINISVTGGGKDERELISNVITTSLVNEGYSNVALVNTIGEPMVGSDVQSLADVLRRNHPDFLEKPVRVWSIPIVDMDDPKLDPMEEGTVVSAVALADGVTIFHQYPAVPDDVEGRDYVDGVAEHADPSTGETVSASGGGRMSPIEEMEYLDANPQFLA